MKRIVGVVLVLLVTFNSIGALAADVDANKIRSEIAKRGTGEKARVRITTRDKVQLQGYISEIGDTSFALTTKNPPETKTLSYSDVIRVRGRGLNKGARIGIGIGLGLAIGTGIAAAFIRAECRFCR